MQFMKKQITCLAILTLGFVGISSAEVPCRKPDDAQNKNCMVLDDVDHLAHSDGASAPKPARKGSAPVNAKSEKTETKMVEVPSKKP